MKPAPNAAASVTASLLERLKQYALLVRLNRPIGIFLLLWPALWALWIAGTGRPDPRLVLIFVAGVVLMRSAGCAINDFADRAIDPHVARTQNRPLARGRLRPREAVGVFGVLGLAAFGLVLLTNPLTVALSVVGVILAVSYPFMKRYHPLPQVHLGAAFGWAVPMAFAAQTHTVSSVGWWLFLATVLWTTAYDTEYAMVDREDDLKLGVKSSAIFFGRYDRLAVGLLHALTLIILLLVGRQVGLGGYFYLGLMVAAGFALYQQRLLVRRVPADCFRAFLNNNYFGLAVFLGIAAHYLLA